jgi:hypothetical protein
MDLIRAPKPEYLRTNNKFTEDQVEVEKIENISLGLVVGAGSNDFNNYRNQRRRERYRLAKMEWDARQAKLKEIEEKNKKIKAERIEMNEKRSLKKAQRRKRREGKRKAAELQTFASDGSFLETFKKKLLDTDLIKENVEVTPVIEPTTQSKELPITPVIETNIIQTSVDTPVITQKDAQISNTNAV